LLWARLRAACHVYGIDLKYYAYYLTDPKPRRKFYTVKVVDNFNMRKLELSISERLCRKRSITKEQKILEAVRLILIGLVDLENL
jgi:hypothetical protein